MLEPLRPLCRSAGHCKNSSVGDRKNSQDCCTALRETLCRILTAVVLMQPLVISQLEFQDSPNPSVFVTTPKVGGTGLNLTAANHAVITQLFWVLNVQGQAFARVVQLGQNRVPHTWLLNTGPNGYDNRASDLHQLSGVAQMRVLHGLMS